MEDESSDNDRQSASNDELTSRGRHAGPVRPDVDGDELDELDALSWPDDEVQPSAELMPRAAPAQPSGDVLPEAPVSGPAADGADSATPERGQSPTQSRSESVDGASTMISATRETAADGADGAPSRADSKWWGLVVGVLCGLLVGQAVVEFQSPSGNLLVAFALAPAWRWGWLACGIIVPTALAALAFVIARRRPWWLKIVIFLVGWALAGLALLGLQRLIAWLVVGA